MTIENLYKKYEKEQVEQESYLLEFQGCQGYDVYNITAPFNFKGKTIIAGRVEKRDSEDSQIIFFEKIGKKVYKKVAQQVNLPLQDPFITKINGTLVLGGVETVKEMGNIVSWHTNFYYLHSLEDAEFIFQGPLGMKDIRLKQLSNNRILVLTRPQGTKGGLGKIGYVIIDTLEDLSIALLEDAPLLKNNFIDQQWGGANEIYELESGRIGVLGHISKFGDNKRSLNYYPIVFNVNLDEGIIENKKIISERKKFIGDAAKREGLYNVVFSGGLVFENEKEVYFYSGIGDTTGQKARLENPFGELKVNQNSIN